MRHQPHLTAGALERLDGGLAVQHRRDDVAVVGDVLLAHDHPVAVADRGLHHRVAHHFEQEQRALADQLARQREHVFDGFLGQDGSTGRDPPENRDECGLRQRIRPGHLGGGRGHVVVGAADIDRPGRLGSRRKYPLRSSVRSWCATEDVDVSPTASPISRMLGDSRGWSPRRE